MFASVLIFLIVAAYGSEADKIKVSRGIFVQVPLLPCPSSLPISSQLFYSPLLPAILSHFSSVSSFFPSPSLLISSFSHLLSPSHSPSSQRVLVTLGLLVAWANGMNSTKDAIIIIGYELIFFVVGGYMAFRPAIDDPISSSSKKGKKNN